MPATHTILQQRYQLEILLGQGGFGSVYRAHDQRLQQTVAIKETIDHTPDRVRQFEYEAHLLAGLRHPALPAVIDHFVENGNHYLVMQYIPGETLSAYLERQPRRRLNEGEALRIVTPLLAALDYMHQRTPPIIHRDIKPDNIRLHPEGTIYLVDFGLAKIYNPALPTTTSARAVTAGFSPLEQYGVGSTDARSDLYALGATLYTMLSGEEVLEAPQRALNDMLLPLRQVNPSISPRMEALVMQLLAMDPEQRYPDVPTLRRDVQEFFHHEPEAPAAAQPSSAGITTNRLTRREPVVAADQSDADAEIAPPLQYLEYASFWHRLIAAGIDGLVIMLCSMLLAQLLALILRIPPPPLIWLMAAILVWCYYPVLESAPTQGTVGKIALGLAVTDLNGNRISSQRAFARHAYRLLSALILPLLLFLVRIVRRPDLVLIALSSAPLLVVLFTQRRQTLHDWMTSCVVVHGRSVQK